jgi:hypothetical protein
MSNSVSNPEEKWRLKAHENRMLRVIFKTRGDGI